VILILMVFHRRLLRRVRRRARRVRSFFRRPKVKKALLPAAIGLLTVLPVPGSRVAAAGLATRAGFGLVARGAIRRFAPRVGRAIGRVARGAGRGFLKFTGLAPFQPIRAGLATVATGALVASPKLRRSVAEVPQRLFGVGTGLGERIEDQPVPETGLGGTPAGLLIGAGLAGLGLGVAAPAIAGAIKARGDVPLSLIPSTGILTPDTQPLGAAQPEVKEEEPKPMEPLTMPSIKITNKPQNNINIKFSKSRRFINQQVLIRK